MTEPTLKLNDQPDPKAEPKQGSAVRWIVLAIALAALFAGVTVAMLFALPRPHTQADYMISGGMATMVTMLALFGVIVATQFRGTEAFYKRRQK